MCTCILGLMPTTIYHNASATKLSTFFNYFNQANLCYFAIVLSTPSHPWVPPRVTILSAVRTLVHCVVKHTRPSDLKSSSIVSLPFAWITGPTTDPSCESLVSRTGAEG